MNAQIQQQSADAKAQTDAQLEQMASQAKIAVNKSKSEGDKEVELIKFASNLYTSALTSGKELPEDIKRFADTILGNAIQPQMQEVAEEQMPEQEEAPEQGGFPEQEAEGQMQEE